MDCTLVRVLLALRGLALLLAVATASAGKFHAAASTGDARLVGRMIDENPEEILHEHNELGHTPLHVAAASGHVDVIRLLVKRGAVVDSRHAKNRLLSMKDR